MAKTFSQTGVSYAKSPLTAMGPARTGIGAGERVRDADVLRAADAAEVSLFKELCVPAWKLVLFDGGTVIPDVGLPPTGMPRIATYSVVAGGGRGRYGGRTYHDLDRVAHRAYGIAGTAALLIRPDNCVAAVLTEDFGPALRRYLSGLYPLQIPADASRDRGLATAEKKPA